MRRIWMAIKAAFAAMSAFTWRRCRYTGRWVLERVASIGAMPVIPIADQTGAIDEPAVTQDERLQRIRKAALTIVAGVPDPEVIALLEERDYIWLSALDKKSLCRIGFASDADLRGHLSGKRVMIGILAADRESVDAYLDWKNRVRHDDESEDDADLSLWSVPGM
jgi:hypothetical protein